jgi:hypothetical protein
MISSRRHSSDEDQFNSQLKNSSVHPKSGRQENTSRTQSSNLINTGTGSIAFREIMNETSRTLINLHKDEERLTANRDSLTNSMISTVKNAEILNKFEQFAFRQINEWTNFNKKVEKYTYMARGNDTLVDKCVDFKRRGEMSIKILLESLDRLKKDQQKAHKKIPKELMGLGKEGYLNLESGREYIGNNWSDNNFS